MEVAFMFHISGHLESGHPLPVEQGACKICVDSAAAWFVGFHEW